MRYAKIANDEALKLARSVAEEVKKLGVVKNATVVPPGFANFNIDFDLLRANARKTFEKMIQEIVRLKSPPLDLNMGDGKTAQVEFVSANPSGPITIGHTRNAVVGDTMARLLEAAGYAVQREYYYNNAGNQMITLGKSLRARYLAALGQDVVFESDFYQGEYLAEIAAELVDEHGDSLRGERWDAFKVIAESRMFGWINNSLASINIQHDRFFNETSLFESGAIWRTLDALRENGHIYESPVWEGADADEIADAKAKGYEPATWFRSATFGDEKDRVMVKSDSVPTYTLPDIAYHRDKLKRGYDIAVNVLGSDHFTQAQVVRRGVQALGLDPAPIHVIFIQMVRAVRHNPVTGELEAVKQSKRAGEFDTLDDLVAMTSADAVRYHLLARRPNSQLDFDVDMVVRQTNENPVYYIQNAHVRCAGILRNAMGHVDDSDADLSALDDEAIAFIAEAYGTIRDAIIEAVVSYQPHKVAFAAEELAEKFHRIYENLRVLHSEVPTDVAKARLRFYRAAKVIFAYLLDLMGMSAPERM